MEYAELRSVEGMYFGGASLSVLLSTAALVVYHSGATSGFVPPVVGAVVCLGLILLDLSVTLISLVPYWYRVRDVKKRLKVSRFESVTADCILATAVLWFCLQGALFVFLARDAVRRAA